MDKFLDTYDHPKLNQEDINQLNRCITSNEIEAVIESHKKENPGPSRFTGEFYQTFKEQLIPTFLNLFHKMEREGTPKLFYEASIILITNQTKTQQKRELQANLFNERRCKNPSKTLAN
jgi:hypothetical protein